MDNIAHMKAEIERLARESHQRLEQICATNDRLMAAQDQAQFLFDLLDDIDTASDRAKSDDKAYREIVERIQRRRLEVATTDGYTVVFHPRETKDVPT